MALSNLAGWSKETVASACGAGDKPEKTEISMRQTRNAGRRLFDYERNNSNDITSPGNQAV